MNAPDSVSLERSILDNLNTATLLFDHNLKLLYINVAAESLLSISANNALGSTANELIACPEAQVEPRFQRALETGDPFTERDVNMLACDGRTIRINCTVLPLHHHGATPELLVEMHQIDRHLRITREEHLLIQHQATRALLRGLAHEIKNPLGGLRGAAQLLEHELPDPDLREYTRIIIDEADRLQTLMNRMLGPHNLPQKHPVNIHHVLEHVRNLVLAESGRNLTILRDYDPSIPELIADQDRLIQAILNIARNAAVATGNQGTLQMRTRVLRQFTIGNQRHRLVLRVEIEDDGPGVPDELIDRIFFPMVSGRSDGTGLGLPIAQELINQHGGLIECESRPGATEFFIYLPLDKNDE